MYTPTYWKILKISSGEKTTYKLLAHWLGGFLDGDVWRLNSGITHIDCDATTNSYTVHGYSGSAYSCPATCEHISGYMIGVIEGFRYRAKDTSTTIEPISMEDYLNETAN